MADDLDEFTRHRIDSESKPDYGILLDIKGYRKGAEDLVRWRVEPVAWTPNIDPADGVYIAEILEKVILVLRGSDYRKR